MAVNQHWKDDLGVTAALMLIIPLQVLWLMVKTVLWFPKALFSD